ncbi:MAG: type 4a pilus biogenesis protein PilO [bacterium]|nr:type 4a pilus biogenesis protein PilO [bacterium]
MNQIIKWVPIILVVLVAINCGFGERKKLQDEMKTLETDIAALKDFSRLKQELDETKEKLSKRAGLIDRLKKITPIVAILKELPSIIPTDARLKDLLIQQDTLDFYISFPGKASFETFKSNLEKTTFLEGIRYYPKEQTAQKGQLSYGVVCYYNPPPKPGEKKQGNGAKKQFCSGCHNRHGHQRPIISQIQGQDNSHLLMGVGNLAVMLASNSNEKLMQEIYKLKEKLNVLQSIKINESRVRKEVKDKQNVLAVLEQIIPSKIDITQVTEVIREVASQCKVTIKTLQPGETKKRALYYEYQFSLEINAQYNSFVKFVETLGMKKRLFYIDRFRILFSQGNLQQSRVDVSLVPSTYAYIVPENKSR